jgi:hypothetical protein
VPASGQALVDYSIELFAPARWAIWEQPYFIYLLVLFCVILEYSRTLRVGKRYTLSYSVTSVIRRGSLHPWHSGAM